MLFYGSHKRLFNRPLVCVKAHIKRAFFNVEKCSPLVEVHCAANKRNGSVCTHVIHLLSGTFPLTVFRRVPPIIIFSPKRVFFGRPFTHVVKKLNKRITPLITNEYTSATVSMILSGILISTAFLHFRPSRVFRRMRHTMSFRVRPLLCNASATLNMAVSKGVRCDSGSVSARTHANPCNSGMYVIRSFNAREPGKGFTRKIKQFTHDILRRCNPIEGPWHPTRNAGVQSLNLATVGNYTMHHAWGG